MNTHLKIDHPFVQPSNACPDAGGWWAQFACPHGPIGLLVGRLMSVKNARMNRFAVEMLDVRPGDQVLEVGFGSGRTIQSLAAAATHGFVAGVDLSPAMVRQAARRNLDQIVAGRVELCQGSVAHLPYEYGRFSKVLAVNNYQFWPNQELNLTEIHRVMREDGRLVLGLRVKEPGKPFQFAPGFTEDEIEETVGLVRWVGFRNVHVAQRKTGRETACILATR
jgi:ubiquinone/menaquinone biosynthesis C-methylase UbiE